MRWKTAQILDLIQEKMLYLRFSGGVSIAVHQKWIKRVPGRVIVIKLALEINLPCVLSGYTPQPVLIAEDKTMFYDDLLATFFACSDFNGNIGTNEAGHEGVYGRYSFGNMSFDGKCFLEF